MSIFLVAGSLMALSASLVSDSNISLKIFEIVIAAVCYYFSTPIWILVRHILSIIGTMIFYLYLVCSLSFLVYHGKNQRITVA